MDTHSQAVLKQIIDKDHESDFGLAAKARLGHLDEDTGLLDRLFKS
ncbi:MAG: hypothetical protein PHC94_07285 [Methylobacter sp.]|nr:hypothetical protein [Methylobacter sp.]